MGKIRIPKAVLIVGTVLVVLAAIFATRGWSANTGQQYSLPLAPPAFVSANSPAASAIADRLDTEAGISAWFQSIDPINLTNAATAFRVIETQTADYIIGSVPVTGYPEHFDAHVYVHKDGWILAYYLRQDPVSKIIDIRAPTISSTNLRAAISTVAGASGVALGTVQYYDFRYPSATYILMVYEDDANGTDYTIKPPQEYGYYERGFALAAHHQYSSRFLLDGVNIPCSYGSTTNYGYCYGVIEASKLLQDVIHTVDTEDDGVLIITYREQ